MFASSALVGATYLAWKTVVFIEFSPYVSLKGTVLGTVGLGVGVMGPWEERGKERVKSLTPALKGRVTS